MSYCIVTGSGGLVGSETVRFFSNVGYNVIGMKNVNAPDISKV